MVIGLFKTAMFLFPFLRELFMGREDPNTQVVGQFRAGFKKMLIYIGLFSAAANVYFINRLYTLAAEHVVLKRQIVVLRSPHNQAAFRARDTLDGLDEAEQARLIQARQAPVSEIKPTAPVPVAAPPKPLPAPIMRPPPPRKHVAGHPGLAEDLARLHRLDSID